eukprot:gnl/Chilomastix_cuspidata/4302.p1 GENE.gnl/Chilomastix_cuspidata/4302~~gnl/Chilomastix_cuspidata/4302.p1  ORF type:complete len:567 (-),score=175.05 gnl/Chilomastix_cuspidata/4302:162-1862(-)
MRSSTQTFFEQNKQKELLVDSIPDSFFSIYQRDGTREIFKKAIEHNDNASLSRMFRIADLDILQTIFKWFFDEFHVSRLNKAARIDSIINEFKTKDMKTLGEINRPLPSPENQNKYIYGTYKQFTCAKVAPPAAPLPRSPTIGQHVVSAVKNLHLSFVSTVDPLYRPVCAVGLWECGPRNEKYAFPLGELIFSNSHVRDLEAGRLSLVLLLDTARADPDAGPGAVKFFSVQILTPAPITLRAEQLERTVAGVKTPRVCATPNTENPLFVAEPIDATRAVLDLLTELRQRCPYPFGVQPDVERVQISFSLPVYKGYPVRLTDDTAFFVALLARKASPAALVEDAKRSTHDGAPARISLATLFGKNTDGDVESGVVPPSSLQLTCPLSHGDIDIPVRGPACTHIPCFDMLYYVNFSLSNRLFNCPVCHRPAPVCALRVDAFMRDLIERGFRGKVRVDPRTGEPTEPPPAAQSSSVPSDSDDAWFLSDSDVAQPTPPKVPPPAVKREARSTILSQAPYLDPSSSVQFSSHTTDRAIVPSLFGLFDFGSRHAALPMEGGTGTRDEPIDID